MMQPDMFRTRINVPTAPEGCKEPRLWVKRLALFTDSKTLRRDIHLRPGLNIIWTPDLSSSGKKALAHGSGKTTFCRLIRACLGEPALATEAQLNRIQLKLPDGFVAAEVMIDGVCWVSMRYFSFDKRVVVQAESIESALAIDHSEKVATSLDTVIQDAFFKDIIDLTPSEISKDEVWDVFRAWLSRDQECRLADIFNWRSPKTQTHSRAQTLGEAAKLNMVRLAFRALDKDEQKASVQERKLSRDAEEERRRQAFLGQQRIEKLKYLRKTLGASEEVGLDDTLGQKGLIRLAEEALAAVQALSVPKPPEVTQLFKQLNSLQAQRNHFVAEKNAHVGKAALEREKATQLRSEAEVGETDATHAHVRVCPICRVSVDEVLATKCKISLEPCNLEAIKAGIQAKKDRANQHDQNALQAESDAMRYSGFIDDIDQEILEVEVRAKNADAELQAIQEAERGIRDSVYHARRILEDTRSLSSEFQNLASTSSIDKKLEDLRSKLEQGRERARETIYDLEQRYRGIMAAWLPDGVDGVIKLDGKGLKVDVNFDGRGEVSTAALDSLKIVAFDLAALHAAVEGKADLPAFLIHDSPREADLDGMLYGRLFTLIAEWEDKTNPPCFQYIVTTTTAPPSALQGDKYVRVKMSSTPANERLFRMDL